MAKIPYLVRRKNVFYFRLGVPVALREIVKSREIIKSLKTEDSDETTRRKLKLAAHFKALLHDLNTGKTSSTTCFDSLDLTSAESDTKEAVRPLETVATPTPPAIKTRKAPLLSAVRQAKMFERKHQKLASNSVFSEGSTLDYQSPIEFEREFYRNTA
ncbi:DUF6538 domain-containing protein [Methylomonas sp. 2BW1-5-20]|uniref:DUF6538 domain-containing protein n=1 Tax=Methylomonas sp. 2BW1-5-20 TaxID=3376686 RepID=UPI0040524FE6